MCSIDEKKPHKLDKKIKRKTGNLINEKPPKLNEEIRKKTDHFVTLYIVDKKPPKSS